LDAPFLFHGYGDWRRDRRGGIRGCDGMSIMQTSECKLLHSPPVEGNIKRKLRTERWKPPPCSSTALICPIHPAAGVFNDVDKPWESLAGRESGAPRSKGGPNPATTNLWDRGDSPGDDHYRGLTPPISPSQVSSETSGHGVRGRCYDRAMLSS